MKYCETCKYRGKHSYCEKTKITDFVSPSMKMIHDMQVYTGSAKGKFWVGEKFGCVHHAEKGKGE